MFLPNALTAERNFHFDTASNNFRIEHAEYLFLSRQGAGIYLYFLRIRIERAK